MAVLLLRMFSGVCFLLSLRSFVFSATEVKVIQSELKLCEKNQRVCVTDLSHCSPPSPSSVHKTLDVWCDYQSPVSGDLSLTCGWSQDLGSEASLIISREYTILSCGGILNPTSTVNVTAKMRDKRTGEELWSQPLTVVLYQAVRPRLTALSEDSLLLAWRSGRDGRCQLRYRPNDTLLWTVQDSVAVQSNIQATHVLKDLLPFTAYSAAVSCMTRSGSWTVWSSEASGTTRDRAPSRSPEVCYMVEQRHANGSLRLQLVWKPLHGGDAGGHVLGYTVSCRPGGPSVNVTGATALFTVEDPCHGVMVAAFNTAGPGPATPVHLGPLTQGLSSVRHLWISSLYPEEPALHVQWLRPLAPLPSHYALLWRSEGTATSGTTVSSFNTSAIIRVDPDASYELSVFPVYNQQCGAAQSLRASVQLGALQEAVGLKVLRTNQSSVTVTWAWQNKSGPFPVARYTILLKKNLHTQVRSVWPDQDQLTFCHLTANTHYYLSLLADHQVTHTILATTQSDQTRLLVPLSVPLLLLLLTLLVVSVVFRTVYRSSCFPHIPDPRESATCRWLEDPGMQKQVERNVLDISRFQVTEILGDKGPVVVSPSSQLLPEEPGDGGAPEERAGARSQNGQRPHCDYQLSCRPEDMMDPAPSCVDRWRMTGERFSAVL